MSDGADLRVPLPLLEQLSKLGADNPQLAAILDGVPGMARFAPTLNISQPIELLALELGRALANARSPKGELLFRKQKAVVTMDEKTGEVKPMTAGRLVGWAAQFVSFKTGGRSNRIREGLSRDDAALVLEQDIFGDCLRELTAVHEMRLPVPRAGGEVEWLPLGYDEPTGIFTLGTLTYDEEWTMERGRDWFAEVCEEIPWNGLEGALAEDRRTLVVKNRSFAVHVAFCVGNYCRALFPEGTLRPVSAIFANKPGSGKTRLAEMQLSHVYGMIGATTVPKDEEKLDVKLETVARALRPYVLFDDIGGSLRSQALNKFITETRHQGRAYGSNSEFFDVPNVTQVMVTANELPTSTDITRRALVAELFLDVEVQGRKFKQEITPEWLALPEVRGRFLSACCALLKHWLADGRKRHEAPLATFGAWAGMIGGIVLAAGMADPMQAPEMDVGGSADEDEVKQLFVAMATSKSGDADVSRAELVALAREMGLLENVLGTEEDPEPAGDQLKRFGRQIQKWRAQKLKDLRGRMFTIGKKHKNRGVHYPLKFIAPPASPASS